MTDPSLWLTYYSEVSHFPKFLLKKCQPLGKNVPYSHNFSSTLRNFIFHASPKWTEQTCPTGPSLSPIHQLANIIHANFTIIASQLPRALHYRRGWQLECQQDRTASSGKLTKGQAVAIPEILKTETEPRRWLPSQVDSNLIPLSAKLQRGWEAGKGGGKAPSHPCSRAEMNQSPTYYTALGKPLSHSS